MLSGGKADLKGKTGMRTFHLTLSEVPEEEKGE